MHLKIKFFFSLFIKKVFFPCTDQIQCCPFLEEKKNIKQIFISNLIFVDCSLMLYIRKVSANFQPKKYSFLRSLWFFQSENIAARGQIRWYFWNWTHKNIPDRQLSAHALSKIAKSSISLHPIWQEQFLSPIYGICTFKLTVSCD